MRKMKKLAVCVMVLMTIALTACGSGTTAPETEEPEVTRAVVETEVEEEPSPEPEVQTVEEPEKPEEVSVQVSGQDRKVSLPKGTMVWLSATGKKFHNKNDCGNMNPEKAVQKPVEEVAAEGIEACENCYQS